MTASEVKEIVDSPDWRAEEKEGTNTNKNESSKCNLLKQIDSLNLIKALFAC